VHIHRFLGEAEPDVLGAPRCYVVTLKGKLVLDDDGKKYPLDSFTKA
jgi:hypothetical protein